jgi:hypothetical protein
MRTPITGCPRSSWGISARAKLTKLTKLAKLAKQRNHETTPRSARRKPDTSRRRVAYKPGARTLARGPEVIDRIVWT